MAKNMLLIVFNYFAFKGLLRVVITFFALKGLFDDVAVKRIVEFRSPKKI